MQRFNVRVDLIFRHLPLRIFQMKFEKIAKQLKKGQIKLTNCQINSLLANFYIDLKKCTVGKYINMIESRVFGI